MIEQKPLASTWSMLERYCEIPSLQCSKQAKVSNILFEDMDRVKEYFLEGTINVIFSYC